MSDIKVGAPSFNNEGKIIAVYEITGSVGVERPLESMIRQAKFMAYAHFGIDEEGHSQRLEEWERSSCDILIEIGSKFIVMGDSVSFNAIAWVEKYED